jgi:hypothetical protein
MDPKTESTPPAAPADRPTVVTRAVWLLYLALLIGFIRAVVTVVRFARGLGGPELFVAISFGVIFFGLYLFLVTKISVGRNWARIVYLILVLVGLPFAIPSYIGELKMSLLAGSIDFMILILQLAGTALLFTSNSNRWFRGRT